MSDPICIKSCPFIDKVNVELTHKNKLSMSILAIPVVELGAKSEYPEPGVFLDLPGFSYH